MLAGQGAILTETVLGIDVGTTAVKAMLVASDGHVLAEAESQHEVVVPQPAWAEQHPDTWWESTRTAVAEVMSLAASAEVKAIGLSGQMHSSVFLDAEDEVIRPALLWSDGRTTSQCREITETLGLDGLRDTVGNLALEGFTAPKVLWLRDNEPEHYGRLRKLMLAKDYVRLKLTGETSTEPSDAAGTLLFDVRQRRWSGEVLSALDIDPAIMPLVVGSTEVSGRLLPDVAKALGLPSGVPVVGGGADNAAGATGSGVIGQGMVQASIGTSGTVLTPLNKPQVDESMSLHTFCHCAGDLWYLMGVILSAGRSLQWLRGITHPGATYDEMTAEAAQVRTGADGLFFLPYLTGERTPHNDSNARGVFFGLHLGHSSAHMVRAVMEAVCFAMRDSLELMRGLDAEVSAARAIGGGARSALWRQMQADVYGVPVEVLGSSGGPAYGAAVMAAVGAGMFGSIAEASESWVSVERTIEPEPKRVGAYDELYAQYRELYPAMKERFATAARLQG